MSHTRMERRTCGDFLVGMELLEEAHGVVDHVRLLCELILGSLDLLDREDLVLCEVGEEREDQVTVAVGDDGFGEVVFGHFGRQRWRRGRGKEGGERRRARRG